VFFITKAFLGFDSYTAERGFFVATDKQFDLCNTITDMSEAFHILIESQHVGERGRYGFPMEEKLGKLGEIMVDDGLSAERAGSAFPDTYPVTLCGENYALKSPFKRQFIIGFSSLYGSYEFSQTVRRSIEEAARKFSNIELILADNRMDPATTMKNVETFIDKKVDLVIEYQHDYNLGPLIVEKLAHADIPILAIDIPIPGAVYFGANNYKAGLIAGEEAAREVKKRWGGELDNIVVMTDKATGPIPENRIAGMLEAFLKEIPFDQDRIVRVNTSNNRKKSEEDTLEILESFPRKSRNLILSFNDIVSLGALEALRKLELEKSSMIVSHSYIRSIARELSRADSPLLGSVAFFPERYGAKIIDLALKMLHKEAVNPNNYTEHLWMAKRS
jgi:ribose transport system substrate-binding protein